MQCCTAQHNTTYHNTAQHSKTHHITTQHSTAQHNTTQHNTTQHNTTQHSTTEYNKTQYNTTRHNTTQHNTIQHTTIQYMYLNGTTRSQYNRPHSRSFAVGSRTHVTPSILARHPLPFSDPRIAIHLRSFWPIARSPVSPQRKLQGCMRDVLFREYCVLQKQPVGVMHAPTSIHYSIWFAW